MKTSSNSVNCSWVMVLIFKHISTMGFDRPFHSQIVYIEIYAAPFYGSHEKGEAQKKIRTKKPFIIFTATLLASFMNFIYIIIISDSKF